MSNKKSNIAAVRLVVLMYFVVVAGAKSDSPRDGVEVRTVIHQALPRLNGAKLATTIVEVTYRPGESSPAHSHTCPVIGYVLSGALKSQVKGEPEHTFHPGESFYEPPNSVHLVSANASTTENTRFLAYFLCDHQGPRSIDADAKDKGGAR